MRDPWGGGDRALESRELSRLFPYTQQVAYLNTAAVGLSWDGQGSAAARFYDENKARGYSGRFERQAELERAQASLAEVLHVRPQDVSFASSTTEALNLVAHSVPLGHGDHVVLCDDEFPSVDLAWSAAALRGAELIRVTVSREETRTEDLIAAITDRTRVVSVSHVHWCTGTRVDLTRIAAATHSVGARLIVDGAHAVGAIDVDASEADFYTGPVFKWLLSAFGIAYVITHESFAAELEPVFRGYVNEPPSRKLQHSHTNHPAIYALSATLEFLSVLGWQSIYERVGELTHTLHHELAGAGWNVITPLKSRAGIVSVGHRDAMAKVEQLSQQGVEIEERAGLLRISPHFYNSEHDVRRLLNALGRGPQ